VRRRDRSLRRIALLVEVEKKALVLAPLVAEVVRGKEALDVIHLATMLRPVT